MSERAADHRRRGPRRALTEDEILDAALALLDDSGPDAASVRGIAARVGVAPNAIYTYFPDKAAVFTALTDRLLGEVDQAVFAELAHPWRERVEALALELRQHLSSHPGAVGVMIRHRMHGPNALALNEGLLQLLTDAGLCPTDAARAARMVFVYVFGSLVLEVAGAQQAGPLPPESARVAARLAGFAETPADRFPLTAAEITTIAAHVSTEQYLWGLRRALDGLAPGLDPPR
jgi:TetR/AcrR family tetracycline transcriptional repressor